MKDLMKWLKDEESGQGMVEYGLILAGIAIVVIAVIGYIGSHLNDKFGEVNTAIGGTGTTG